RVGYPVKIRRKRAHTRHHGLLGSEYAGPAASKTPAVVALCRLAIDDQRPVGGVLGETRFLVGPRIGEVLAVRTEFNRPDDIEGWPRCAIDDPGPSPLQQCRHGDSFSITGELPGVTSIHFRSAFLVVQDHHPFLIALSEINVMTAIGRKAGRGDILII